MSHPAPDYSITFLLHFHLLSFTSVLHVPEGVVHQHFECWKGFGLSFQSPFVGAVPQSVQQLLMRLWHFCVSFMTDIKLKPCAIRLYWTFQMFISPKRSETEKLHSNERENMFWQTQEIPTQKLLMLREWWRTMDRSRKQRIGICLILFVITNVRCKLHLEARRNLSSNLPSKKSSYKSRRRQVMDLEANKLIFHPKKSPEKVDSRWWQMEDVNKYLRKKGERIGQKVGGGVKRRRHGVRDWRRKQIFHRSLRRMTRLGGPQMELDTLLNCD